MIIIWIQYNLLLTITDTIP